MTPTFFVFFSPLCYWYGLYNPLYTHFKVTVWHGESMSYLPQHLISYNFHWHFMPSYLVSYFNSDRMDSFRMIYFHRISLAVSAKRFFHKLNPLLMTKICWVCLVFLRNMCPSYFLKPTVKLLPWAQHRLFRLSIRVSGHSRCWEYRIHNFLVKT